jgi:uncharacterized protein with FMN-binding domain
MKKIILSSLAVITFVAYGLYQKNQKPVDAIVTDTQNTNTQTTTVGEIPSPIAAQKSSKTPVSKYKDGTYTGDSVDAYYGNVQIKATIKNGKISDIVFLQYPNDRDRSLRINTQAMPVLKQEAIQAQNASVDIISGATDTSQAFIQSLDSALTKSLAI